MAGPAPCLQMHSLAQSCFAGWDNKGWCPVPQLAPRSTERGRKQTLPHLAFSSSSPPHVPGPAERTNRMTQTFSRCSILPGVGRECKGFFIISFPCGSNVKGRSCVGSRSDEARVERGWPTSATVSGEERVDTLVSYVTAGTCVAPVPFSVMSV